MSAPGAAVLRELGAEPRRFKSVKAAVKFYEAFATRRASTTQDLSRTGVPSSREKREQDLATYSLLLCVFRARDAGIDDENLLWSLGVTMDWLSGTHSNSYLMTRSGIRTEEGFSRYVGRVEKILLERMRARDMVEEDAGE